ncbi:4-hydroxy-tetrahydrodipicolinate synthase [Folsomia candida]|uniref:4-hydroxy-tetrahydrodipicolinate synthase n=1 Tax=Folsomia candida TaxID=158441 RepID=A0A226D160_FOLCA|nr:4-hydroxy-tetrahydrodipicolinate synthase [Folsomia candida]
MWEQEQQQRCLLSPNELDLDDMERLNFHGEELIKKQIAATQQNTSRRLLRAISLVQAGGAAAVKARLVIVNVELAAPAISSLLSPLELYFSPIRFLNCCRNLITVGIKINEKKCSMHEQTGIYGKSRKLFISIRSTNLSPIQIKQSFAKGADEKSLLLLFITSPPRETNYCHFRTNPRFIELPSPASHHPRRSASDVGVDSILSETEQEMNANLDLCALHTHASHPAEEPRRSGGHSQKGSEQTLVRVWHVMRIE